MRGTPMMANPFEYRTKLWEALYEGETRGETREIGKRSKAAAKKATPKLTTAESRKLDAFRERILALQAARAQSPPPTPDET